MLSFVDILSSLEMSGSCLGDVLVVSRVMLGRPYRGQVKEIPEGFNCKIVERSKGQNAGIILVDQEEQILPTFIVKGNSLKYLM